MSDNPTLLTGDGMNVRKAEHRNSRLYYSPTFTISAFRMFRICDVMNF